MAVTMNVMERTRMAVNAGINAWRGFGQGTVPLSLDLLHLPSYAVRWTYFTSRVFAQPELRAVWEQTYRQSRGLYAGQRALYNPTHRVVDFYVGKIYPGVLTEDGRPLPEGIPSAVPLADDMTPTLKSAVAQLLQWTNFSELKDTIVTWGAALGDLLVEIDDDVSGGKVRFRPVWPDDVLHITQEAGNLKAYIIEYRARDDQGSYTYRKEVDKQTVRTYRDGYLYGYGDQPAEYEHGYGFVPARWVRHRNIGSDRGAPAMHGDYDKLDHLMALASHVHDQVHRTVNGDMLIAGPGKIAPVAGAKPDPYNPDSYVRDAAQGTLWDAPAGTTAAPLIIPLALAEALALMQDLMGEIEADRPELKVYEQIRGVSSLTGPAIERMVGDAAAPLYAAQAQYDGALTSLLQMGVAIAGMRYANRNSSAGGIANGWSVNTIQQQRFAPFDLGSYDRGELNIVIEPRPILPPTALERITAKAARWQGVSSATSAGAPLALAMADFDFPKDEIAATVLAQAERQARAAQIQENIANAQQGTQQNGAQPQQQGANNGANNG